MRLGSIGSVLGVLVFSLGAQSAEAGSPAVTQRTDPPAGSPAGVIYQIPLDSARRDAAPVLPAGSHRRGHGGGVGGSRGGSVGGSGAQVGDAGAGALGGPGGQTDSGGGSGAASGSTQADLVAARGATNGTGSANDPSSIHSENGFGSSSQVPGVSPAAVRMGAGVAAAHGAGSAFPSYLLVAVIALAAVAVGLVATRVKNSVPQADAKPPTVK